MKTSDVPASRETDRLVSNEALCEYPADLNGLPCYSTSMDAALVVMNQIMKEGAMNISLSQAGVGQFTCSIFRGFVATQINAPTSVSADADTAPLAVCRAALEWAKVAR